MTEALLTVAAAFSIVNVILLLLRRNADEPETRPRWQADPPRERRRPGRFDRDGLLFVLLMAGTASGGFL